MLLVFTLQINYKTTIGMGVICRGEEAMLGQATALVRLRFNDVDVRLSGRRNFFS